MVKGDAPKSVNPKVGKWLGEGGGKGEQHVGIHLESYGSVLEA